MRQGLRINDLPPYLLAPIAAAVNAARLAGRDVIDLSQINPDMPPPQAAVDRLVQASLLAHHHRYPSSQGIARLRERICAYYGERFGVALNPEKEAVVTIGTKEGLSHLLLAICESGDRVVVPAPAYPMHTAGVFIAGARVQRINLFPSWDEAEKGQYTLSESSEAFFESLKQACGNEPPRAMIVNFPHNPTAAVVSPGFFERLAAFCRERGIYLLHDFAYADTAYGDYRPPSILASPDARKIAVEFYSLSKSFSMAGWRVGFCVGSEELISALKKIKSCLDFGLFLPLQLGALQVLGKPEDVIEETRAVYQSRRDLLAAGLRELGWTVNVPRAGTFVWAKLPAKAAAEGSMRFSQRLLEEANIAVCPGAGFDQSADSFVRFALVENENRIRAALRRMASFVMLIMLMFTAQLEARAEDCPQAARLRESAAKQLGGSREQEQTLREAVSLCPALAAAHFDLGVTLLAQHRHDEALESFRLAYKQEPSAVYRLGIANALAGRGELDAAEDEYEKVRDGDPRNVRALQGLAYVYTKKGQYTEAEDSLRQAIQIDPDDERLFYDLGLVLEKLGRMDEAITSFQTAVEKQGSFPEAVLKLGEARLAQRKLDLAEKALNRAVFLAPKSAAPHVLLAALYEQKRNISEAKASAERAYGLEPQHPDVIKTYAAILYASGEKEPALRRLKEAVQQFPQHAPLHAAYGWALLQEKDYEGAKQELLKAAELEPDRPQVHNNLGVVFELLGDRDAAEKHFKKAKELNPRLVEAEQNLRRMESE